MNQKEKNRLFWRILLPAAGTVFLAWYIFAAGADVVYSDYIRIINEYLPDVGNPEKFLVPDILTRIPVCFPQRFINVKCFGYSVTFDRICTLSGIVLMAFVLMRYAETQKLGIPAYAAVMTVLFSLSKWEVLMNGTCWAHMTAIGLFLADYILIEDIWRKGSSRKTAASVCVMPFLCLTVSGEYIASYAVTVIMTGILGAVTGGAPGNDKKAVRKVFLGMIFCTGAALMLYMLSRSFAVWEHSGAADMTLPELLFFAPSFLPRLFLKGFAGDIAGQETLLSLGLSDTRLYLLGAVMLAAYAAAFVLYFVNGMAERTVFPLLMLVSGFINHCLVAYARWIFLNENYLLSSRYAGQFMTGTIGILLVFALYEKSFQAGRIKKAPVFRAVRVFAFCTALLVIAGNIYTSYDEIRKAPYRKANYEEMASVIREHENYPDEELCRILEWHKDPQLLRKSIKILEDNRLNVFSPSNDAGFREKGDKAA